MECVFGRPTARGPSEARRSQPVVQRGRLWNFGNCAREAMEIHRISIELWLVGCLESFGTWILWLFIQLKME